jgi:ribosomal protein S12 methylthiotransferase accessory factor
MSAQDLSVQRLFDVLDALVDDQVGIIRSVSEIRNPAGAPEFFHYAAEACHTKAFSPQKNFADAGGASTDRRIAMAKAVGEAVERYCSALYVQQELPLASAGSAPFRCVDPSDFALFSPGQYSRQGFPYAPFAKDTLLRWTETVDLMSSGRSHLPACMVYLPYAYDRDAGEEAITQPISTGLACHCSWTEAAVSSICEVIERDAFMIAWQAMIPAPPIRLDSLSDDNRDLVARFERTGDSVRILNLTLDHGVPCILSILVSERPNAPALVFAASAALSPEEAVRKSLEEVAHTRRYAAQLKTKLGTFEPVSDYSNVVNQETHVRLYTDQTSRSLANFLFSSESWIDVHELEDFSGDSPDASLRNLVEAIASTSHAIFVKDLTTSDVQELGLSVVRAVIPGFHPLFMGHGNRALGGIRLWSVPQALGYAGITNQDNPAPHPYP